jgi:hypothetical protein
MIKYQLYSPQYLGWNYGVIKQKRLQYFPKYPVSTPTSHFSAGCAIASANAQYANNPKASKSQFSNHENLFR